MIWGGGRYLGRNMNEKEEIIPDLKVNGERKDEGGGGKPTCPIPYLFGLVNSLELQIFMLGLREKRGMLGRGSIPKHWRVYKLPGVVHAIAGGGEVRGHENVANNIRRAVTRELLVFYPSNSNDQVRGRGMDRIRIGMN